MTIQWTRSKDGKVVSKDGQWLLTANFYHGKIGSWTVTHALSGKRFGFRDTLWEAKVLAKSVLNSELETEL